MADLQGRKVFKVFNQDFIVDERYNVTKELGQGAYGIVWYVSQSFGPRSALYKDFGRSSSSVLDKSTTKLPLYLLRQNLQRSHQQPYWRRCCNQESHQRVQQEDSCEAGFARDQASTALSRSPQCKSIIAKFESQTALLTDGPR